MIRPYEILLIEDNPGDVRLVRESLGRSVGEFNLRVAPDGVEALAYVRRQGQHANAPQPDLILLDLNLPRKNGRQVLAELKADESLARIPVVILSSSNASADISAAYGLRANSYVTKPGDLDEFVEAIGTLKSFWLSLAQLPSRMD